MNQFDIMSPNGVTNPNSYRNPSSYANPGVQQVLKPSATSAHQRQQDSQPIASNYAGDQPTPAWAVLLIVVVIVLGAAAFATALKRT